MNDKTEKIGPITIRPRGKKGIYVATFWHDGKHHRRSLKTTNVKVARERAIKLAAQLSDGELEPKRKPVGIESTITDFRAYLKTEGRRSKTCAKYRGFLKIFQTFCTDRHVMHLGRITPTLVDQFRAVRKQTLSDKSMHNEGVMLKAFFRWGKQRKLIAGSPMEDMTFKKPPLHVRGGPSLTQVQQILMAASDRRRTQFALLAFSGMRSGEAQHMLLSDIDFDLKGNWLHIISRDEAETKTGEARKVPIHVVLRELLAPLVKRRKGWLFCESPSRKYPAGDHWLNTKWLNEDFKKILRKLKIPAGKSENGFSVHSLRSFFKTFCVNSGVPRDVVDIWQGHAHQDRTASAHYYKLSDEDSQRFMKMVPFATGMPPADADKTQEMSDEEGK